MSFPRTRDSTGLSQRRGLDSRRMTDHALFAGMTIDDVTSNKTQPPRTRLS